MPKYRVPRITIGADTKELILELRRTLNSSFNDPTKLEIVVSRHECNPEESYLFTAYEVCGNKAHFNIPDDFITSDVASGFYIGEVFFDECPITKIEIIKAPSIYVGSAQTVDHECGTNNWQEPPCEDDDLSTCGDCGTCFSPATNGCPTCCDEEDRRLVATYEQNDYIGDPNG